MSFRFRHSLTVSEGVRLVRGQRVINLSDLTRAKAWSANDKEFGATLTLPSAGLHYSTRFDNSRAHQYRAFQLREWQKWKNKAFDLSIELERKKSVAVGTLEVLLNDEGYLSLRTTAGDQLNESEIKKMSQELPQLVRCWLEERAWSINGPLCDYISTPIEAPLLKDDLPVYVPVEFTEEQPQRPELASLPPEPPYPQPPAIRLWHKLIPGRQQQMAREHQAALHEWQTAKLRWKAETHQVKATADRVRQRYKAYSSVWKARKLAHDAEQQVYAEQFATLLLNDEFLMTEILIAELNQLDWARQTSINFQLDLNQHTLWLDVELPALDFVSDQVAEVVLGQPALKVRTKPEQQRLDEYVEYIYATILRLVGVTLGSLPAMETVIISGYTQRQDSNTGFEVDEFLISVKADRQTYLQLTFDEANISTLNSLLEKLSLKVSIRENGFQSIQPYDPND